MPSSGPIRRGDIATPSQTPPPRWWVEGAGERCPHCLCFYAYEVEYRCVACDAPICPMCVVRLRLEILCPDCGPEEG